MASPTDSPNSSGTGSVHVPPLNTRAAALGGLGLHGKGFSRPHNSHNSHHPGGMGIRRNSPGWHPCGSPTLGILPYEAQSNAKRSPVTGRLGLSPVSDYQHEWGDDSVHRTPTAKRSWQEQPPNKEARHRQRIKQVALGKATKGYMNYSKAIPKAQRQIGVNLNTPSTSPRTIVNMSKRQFHGELKAWRKYLHQFDDIEGQGTFSQFHDEEEEEEEQEDETPPLQAVDAPSRRRKARGSPISPHGTPVDCYDYTYGADHYAAPYPHLPPTAMPRLPATTSPYAHHMHDYGWGGHAVAHPQFHGTPPATCALTYHSSGSSAIYDDYIGGAGSAHGHYDSSGAEAFPSDPDMVLSRRGSGNRAGSGSGSGVPHTAVLPHGLEYCEDLASLEPVNSAKVEDDDDDNGEDGLDEIQWVFPIESTE